MKRTALLMATAACYCLTCTPPTAPAYVVPSQESEEAALAQLELDGTAYERMLERARSATVEEMEAALDAVEGGKVGDLSRAGVLQGEGMSSTELCLLIRHSSSVRGREACGWGAKLLTASALDAAPGSGVADIVVECMGAWYERTGDLKGLESQFALAVKEERLGTALAMLRIIAGSGIADMQELYLQYREVFDEASLRRALDALVVQGRRANNFRERHFSRSSTERVEALADLVRYLFRAPEPMHYWDDVVPGIRWQPTNAVAIRLVWKELEEDPTALESLFASAAGKAVISDLSELYRPYASNEGIAGGSSLLRAAIVRLLHQGRGARKYLAPR